MVIICSGCRKEECDDVETISQRKGTSASNYKEQSIYNDTACYTAGDHGHDYKQFQPVNDTSWFLKKVLSAKRRSIMGKNAIG